jgi:hypothetical protein
MVENLQNSKTEKSLVSHSKREHPIMFLDDKQQTFG